MKRTFMLISGFLLLTATATSWGQEGLLSPRARASIRSDLRGLRLLADQQARNCDQEGQGQTADLMRRISSAALGINQQIGTTIRTWEAYRDRFFSDIMSFERTISAAPEVNTCRPSEVSVKLLQVSGFVQAPPP